MAYNTQSISPSDLSIAWELFDAAGITRSRVRFAFSEADDRFELRDALDDSLVAYKENGSVEWTEV